MCIRDSHETVSLRRPKDIARSSCVVQFDEHVTGGRLWQLALKQHRANYVDQWYLSRTGQGLELTTDLQRQRHEHYQFTTADDNKCN